MSDNQELGQLGEDIAVAHLEEKGYKIRERNWRFGRNELDIIAEKGKILVIVEVKTRKLGSMLPPAAAVDRAKRSIMVRAADAYIRWHNLDVNARFDIISIETDGKETRLDHIDDAFYPTLGMR